MKKFFSHLILKSTTISISTLLFFIYIIFFEIYKIFKPPKVGSAYNMILEMLLIFSILPLVLFIIDRILVIKINNIKLTIIESVLFGIIFLYYFLIVNPF